MIDSNAQWLPRGPTVLCLFLLGCCILNASAKRRPKCEKGMYWNSPSGHCIPCKHCRSHKVITRCSLFHDTVCAVYRVFHFPCTTKELPTFFGNDNGARTAEEEEEKWGLFVEDKETSFRRLTKKDRTKARRKLCHSLKRYRKRTLFSAAHLPLPPPPYYTCREGFYQWSTREPNNSFSGLDCRPCSQCPKGTRQMSVCGGVQDTLCSFDRVNSTVELFRMACKPSGPIIQVYSSRPPSVSSAHLVVIQDRLERSLCRTLNRTILEPPSLVHLSLDRRVAAPQKKVKRLEKEVGRESRPSRNKLRPKTNRKNRRKKGKRPSGEGGENDTGRDNGKRAKKNKNYNPKDQKKREPKESDSDSMTPPTAAAPVPQTTLLPPNPATQPGTTTTSYTHHSAPVPQTTLLPPNPATQPGTTATSYTHHSAPVATMTSTNGVIIKTGSSTARSAEFEVEEDGDEETKVYRLVYVLLGSAVAVILMALSTLVVRVFIRRRKKREDYIDDSVNVAFFVEDQNIDSLSKYIVSNESSASAALSAPRTIVDPLRMKSRPKSHDSGYLTAHSEGSQQGSRSLCRESQSTDLNADTVTPEPILAVLCRNSVSTLGFVNVGDSSSSSRSPVPGALMSGAKPHLTGDRRARSLSEDCCSSAAGSGRRSLAAPSPLCSFPPLYDRETESRCSKDEGIENSQESVFNSTPQLSVESLSDECGSETDLNLGEGLPGALEDQTSTPPVECESDERDRMKRRLNNYMYAADNTWDVGPTPRYPSGLSSSSSASSSVSIPLRIPLNHDLCQNMPSDWLHKDKDVGPENFLSTYSCSVMTQTEDWTKTNLRRRPMFSSSWQGCRTFTAAGGTWTLPGSDARLEVPPNAVVPEDSVDITAATCTNLAHLRQVLKLADQDIMVGPLVEFDAGSGFRFGTPVHAYLPHCLPSGLSDEHVKLHHIDKGVGGEFIIRRMPSKREYDLKQKTALLQDIIPKSSGGSLSSKDPSPTEIPLQQGSLFNRDATGEEDDIGYFQLLPSGELRVVTGRFCGYTCSICNNHVEKPKVHLAVTAKQLVKATPSGPLPQVRLFLYMWDQKITISDFKRDYLGNEQVAEQVLHAIDEFKDSLVKLVLTINEDESQQHWKHALRPGTTTPIFPAERSFSLRELLCCHAKDCPRSEEWLAENTEARKPGASCYDFQCIIDVFNEAHPSCPLWQAEDVATTPDPSLQKSVTLYIWDLNNNNSNDINDSDTTTAATNRNDSSNAVKAGMMMMKDGRGVGMDRRSTANPWQLQQSPIQHMDSSTPYGRMEQGPSQELPSDVPGWEPLSDEVCLDPNPRDDAAHRSEPTPLGPQDAQQISQTQARPVFCPQSVPDLPFSGSLAAEYNPDQHQEIVTAMVKAPLTGEGTKPNAVSAGLHLHYQRSGAPSSAAGETSTRGIKTALTDSTKNIGRYMLHSQLLPASWANAADT